VGEAPYSPDFIVPGEALQTDLPNVPHVMYTKGMEFRATDGAAVLADVQVPYFNRTWRHYCSHQHTPSRFEVGYPGIIESPDGQSIIFAHPIFSQYQHNSPLWVRKLLDAAIRRMLPTRIVETNGPSSLLVSINEQPAESRYVVHLLHYIPERRNGRMDIIEDVIPLHDLTLSLVLPKSPTRAATVPDDEDLAARTEDGRFIITLPRLDGHQMLQLHY
jgi:hypothetical protein